jgi:hypothetical protein
MRLKKLVGAVYTSTTFGTFPGLSIGTFLLSVDSQKEEKNCRQKSPTTLIDNIVYSPYI